jgi:hypothetical protein
MHVELYDPRVHDPVLAQWANAREQPFNADSLSAHGYVVRWELRPIMAIFAYRDPTSAMAFVDNLLADPEAPLLVRLAALRVLLRSVHEHLVSEGVGIIRFTTASRAIQWLFETAGVLPFGEKQHTFIMRIGGHHA